MNRFVVMLGALGLVFGCVAAAPAVDGRSPESIVRSLYTPLVYSATHHGAHAPASARYLTPRLNGMFRWADAVEKCTHTVVLDWDPYSGMQVPMKAYRLAGTRTLPGTKTVEVRVDITDYKGGSTHAFADTVKTANGWRIDDFKNVVDNGKPFSVYADLEKQRAEIESGHHKPLTSAQKACIAARS